MRGEIAAEHERARRLMAGGLVGQATITAVRETGTSVNANPVVEFDLPRGGEAHPSGGRGVAAFVVRGV
jgi:hypothetical protein